MAVRKKIIYFVIFFISLCIIPSISNAADYVVCLDAGHSDNENHDADVAWFKEMNGEEWKSEWGTNADYDNKVNGIITTTEGSLTKKTVMYMVEYLKQYDNIKVVISPRTGNGHYSDRPLYGKEKNANVHVSVHYNSTGGAKKGTLTEYKPRRFYI